MFLVVIVIHFLEIGECVARGDGDGGSSITPRWLIVVSIVLFVIDSGSGGAEGLLYCYFFLFVVAGPPALLSPRIFFIFRRRSFRVVTFF